jgi:hypothetical protein
MSRDFGWTGIRVAALAAGLAIAAPAAAQPSSAALAKQLTAAMAAQNLDAFAAQDPQAPDGFVAVLAYPNVQLLVMGARYPVPAALQQQLKAHQYKDVYSALQMNGIKDSRVFVQDMQADGLRATDQQTADIVYEKMVDQTVLSGDTDKSEYRRTLTAKDTEYSRMLNVLLDALQQQPNAPAAIGS